jgi:hypothetical protein
MAKAKSAKSVGLKVRPVGSDGFYSDEPEQKNIKRPKKPKSHDAKSWWARKLGFGDKRGEGALAKRRKETIDTNIEKGS